MLVATEIKVFFYVKQCNLCLQCKIMLKFSDFTYLRHQIFDICKGTLPPLKQKVLTDNVSHIIGFQTSCITRYSDVVNSCDTRSISSYISISISNIIMKHNTSLDNISSQIRLNIQGTVKNWPSVSEYYKSISCLTSGLKQSS